ncbi:hypothetical protein PHYBOEH_005809 [Phytophthora boehmeriae]|uniref:Uncharacterized protein n=1 Tax=Phytophthora boehmeriae TaxID=109152 RepID=A0A8T1X534_9STRA|nr:hypothetical protein PHYBOEH_005809 [Phytophthora boehmeriae]
MADEEVGATGAARSGGNPLLVGAPPVEETVDRQIHALITTSDNIYFDQWKKNYYRGTPTRLRAALTQLLPTLVGARDYAGAAKVLAIMYHRFSVTPALCVEASLEVMRRQQDYRSDLLNFYESALKDRRLDKMLLLKEMLLFHIIHGEFYEAYRLYQDKIQNLEEAEKDARLLANFGMLCYWLLFIESKEMRDMLKQQELDGEDGDDDDDDDDDDMEDNDNGLERRFQSSENVESVIESTYLFKTPIGVHVLYQHASGALRRAVALCPHSAMYVEHYSQLLILVGSVQSACDYLESYFHAHPADPHGARMLSGFLERYYPDSVDAQVSVYIRWMKADPSCIYALEKVMELSSAGAISSYTLTKALVEALDLCGSDMHVIQNPQVAITLWRNLAELLTAMDDEEFATAQVDEASTEASYNHETIADIGAQRLWWKRLYFLRPSTVKEVVAASNSGTALMEVSIYRAAVANRLFPGRLAMAELRVKSIFEVTPDVVKAAILEMKRVLPSSHPHFPGESLVELLMCNKMSSFARQRRVRLAEIRRALRPILKLFMYVNENELAAGAWAVCKEGGLEGVISREDVMRTVQSLLPGHYFWVIEGIDYRSQHALANPVVRGTSNDPEKILRSMKRRHKYTKVTIPHIQAVMWMERYEAAHGRFVDDDSEFWERAKRAKRTKPNKQNDVDIIVLDADGEERRGTRRGRIAKRIKPNKQNDKDADATVIDEGIAEEKKSTDDTSEEEDDRGSDYGEESN